MIDKQAVGERIASMRRQLGVSQAAFAQRLHVSTQAVSKWETGLSLPDIEILLNISWICQASLHTILEGEDFLDAHNGIDRGLSRIDPLLICPQCGGKLTLQFPQKGGKQSYACAHRHVYEIVDGVVHFGTREIPGELWSLWLRNYDHYLVEQRHPGNPRYQQGKVPCMEIMWQQMEALKPRTILDIACGTGSGIKHMIERIHWPTTVIMMDLSHRILKWNRVFFSEEWKNPYVDMVYLACDCGKMPLKDDSVDMIWSNGGFESMPNKMDGFQEGYRVLKPGGHALYNMSVVDDYAKENTRKWIRLYKSLDPSYSPNDENLPDRRQWLAICEQTGYMENKAILVYGELPAPEGEVFPFENEVLQWMAREVIVSRK